MIICSNCARECSDSMYFCPECGTSLKKKPDTKELVAKYFKIVIGRPVIALLKFIGMFVKKHYFGFVLIIELIVLVCLYGTMINVTHDIYGDVAYFLIFIPVVLAFCCLCGFAVATSTPEGTEKFKNRYRSFKKWLNEDEENKIVVLVPVGIVCIFLGMIILAILREGTQ